MIEHSKSPLRAGHISGALNIPWSQAANPDETFKSITDLKKLYEEEHGLKGSDEVIAYCRIGERSGHTWFVLTYLLAYDNVKSMMVLGRNGEA